MRITAFGCEWKEQARGARKIDSGDKSKIVRGCYIRDTKENIDVCLTCKRSECRTGHCVKIDRTRNEV
jgi:hypothetical protein